MRDRRLKRRVVKVVGAPKLRTGRKADVCRREGGGAGRGGGEGITASKYCTASSIGTARMVSVGEQPTKMPAAMGSVVLSHIRFFRGRLAGSVRVAGFLGGATRPMHRLATRSGRDVALRVVQNI